MNRISASEANGLRFFQSPKAFITDDFYKPMSVYAKYLYGILRDRFDLSFKNGWVDEDGFIYIYFTLDEIREALGVGKTKAIQIKKELQDFDLLEEVQQGINKPNRLYIGQVVFHRVEPNDDAEVQNMNPRKSDLRTPGSSEYELQEVQNMNPNDTEFSDTERTDTELTKDEEEDIKRRAKSDSGRQQNLVHASLSDLYLSEPWLNAVVPAQVMYNWQVEHPEETYWVVDELVTQYWRLRRAKDEGALNTIHDASTALEKIFFEAKSIADKNVVDASHYFDYLKQGIVLQSNKFLISS